MKNWSSIYTSRLADITLKIKAYTQRKKIPCFQVSLYILPRMVCSGQDAVGIPCYFLVPKGKRGVNLYEVLVKFSIVPKVFDIFHATN